MKYSIGIFILLFAVIWVMHKPFDVHRAKPRLKRFHEWLELALVVQGIIILNQLVARIPF